MTESPPESIPVPIEWRIPVDLETHYATNMIIQYTEDEFVLYFFETLSPPLFGTLEERKSQLEKLGAVQGKCVARIVVSPTRMPKFYKAIRDHLKRFAPEMLDEGTEQ